MEAEFEKSNAPASAGIEELLKVSSKSRHVTPWRRMVGMFGAALIAVASLMPVIATLLTVAVYFAISQFVAAKFYSLVIGATVTLVIWLLSALFYSPHATAENADRYTFSKLRSQMECLNTPLNLIQNKFSDQRNLPVVQHQAFNEAFDAYQEANSILHDRAWGLMWISGAGHVEVSRIVHRGEEAMLMVESIEEVITDGTLLKEDIMDAKISNPALILRSLESALSDLGEQDRDKIKEMKARAAIRQARRLFNEFQDELSQNQVDIRSQISLLTFLTGLAVYVLLAFAILVNVQFSRLVSVTFFYLIGTCTGLLGRLYERVQAKKVVDDTRFRGAYLMTVPLLSGLAAIGGVTAMQKIATTSGSFSFDLTLFNILAAAAFGLTPNLFFRALQRQGEAIDKGNQP